MKKAISIITIILIFFFMTLSNMCYAEKQQIYKNSIILIDKKTQKQIGEYSVEEFESLIHASENYYNLIEAESNKRVKITAIVEEENTEIYISNILIKYYDKDDRVFKTLLMNAKFKVKENTNLDYKIKKYYYQMSAYSLPIIVLILIILL